jgi:ferredoxin
MFRNTIFTLFVVVVALAASPALGFSTLPSTPRQDTSLDGLFDGFAGAFSNEEMGAKKNEGLANGPDYNENVTVNGKKVQGAVVGQKLTVVAGRARVKIPVNCQKGDCGTCVVNMNGKKVKACQTQLGKGKCSIDTL